MTALAVPGMERVPAKALCHPSRPNFGQGLCRQCWRLRDKGIAPRDDMQYGRSAGKIARHNELIAMQQATEYLEGLGRAAKAILRENMPEYAELHLEAARNAALEGDAKPSQWAMEHVKIVDKPIVDPAPKEGGAGGVKVFLGIKIGSVPEAAISAVVTEGETIDE